MDPTLTTHRLALRGDHAGAIGAGERARTSTGRRRMRGEQGYILAMTALLILPLLVFVSFAIDAGSWYAQASRMQRAADAAALAAVVWLPNTTSANLARDTVAAQNGYTSGVTGSMTSPTTYQVSITATAPRFFSATFDSSPYDLTRSAEAEFNKPVPLGSPTNKMGNDVTACPQFQPSQGSPCGPQPMLWSSIQGPYETFENGDPYTTKCARNTTPSPSGCSAGSYPRGATNELYRTTGYNFAIDVKPADVGKALTLEVWDQGSYPRRVGTTKTVTGSINSGQTTFTRTSGSNFVNDVGVNVDSRTWDIGKEVTGPGIPADTYIIAVPTTGQVTLSKAATSGGSRTISVIPDCRTNAAPFNASPYSGSVGQTNCQTGDSNVQANQIQVFDNDGEDLTVDYSVPLTNCHSYIPANPVFGDGNGPWLNTISTYKNKWASVCTFTASKVGVYPVRVKSSAITLPGGANVPDTGSGYNEYSLRVLGGTTTRMYALDDISMWTNTPASDARFYLADIGPEHAGKRLQLDLYDPGDGNSGTYTMQVLAPVSGAPATIPTAGTSIPAPNRADSCRYNNTPSATRGPNVTAPAGNPAANCTVTTRDSSLSTPNKYNNHWLRIEIKISDTYTCTTDCWWTIRYDFGGSGGVPTDRTVWSIKVVGDPVHLIE